MNRGYERTYYAEILAGLRRINPLMAVGTDLIVGFPGETEEDFEDTVSFVEEMAFSRIHVFRFSPRKGTPAAELPGRVPEAEKDRRSKIIQEIASRSTMEFSSRFLGKEIEVLFERSSEGFWTGLSGEYLPVKMQSSRNLKNELIHVRVSAADPNGLMTESIIN
jgi:threonylcarbamoyladenosine tRNA methylthiotransferase MtaB